MNLATARSAARAKEVGVRKVLGAERKKLALQFLGESFVFTILSLAAAVAMAQIFLPTFRVLAGKVIPLDFFKIPYLFMGTAVIALFVGLAAGSYPALFLSSFKPVVVLRDRIQQGSKSSGFRSVLVIFQFAVSIVLIICTMVVFKQHKFMQDKDLGFNKRDLLVIALQNKEVRLGLESFKDEALRIIGVVSTGASSMVPGEIYLFNIGTYPEGFSRDQVFRMDNFRVDYGFLDTLEIRITQGRGFSKERISDHADGIMINETAASRLGWDDSLGKMIDVPFRLSEDLTTKTVIGVFKDIHQRSLYSSVSPTVIEYISNEGGIDARARRLTLRLETDDLERTMVEIEQKWKEMFPNNPYYSFFLDEFYSGQHRSEERLGNIFRAFSVLAVVIGCLGLLGLVSFTAERRTKEIGIRKVLGSSIKGIVVLLCRRFFFLVVASNLLAWPIAYMAMRLWLRNFPYPVKMGIGVFAGTALFTLLIALLTVSYQAIKAARVDPVRSLRYE
jgi:putative ABC transport system permease protein